MIDHFLYNVTKLFKTIFQLMEIFKYISSSSVIMQFVNGSENGSGSYCLKLKVDIVR